MPGLKVGLRAAAIYIAIVALGMAFVFQVYDAPYGSAAMISRFWVIELILTIVTLYYALRYFGLSRAGFGAMNWREVIWLSPAYIVLAVMLQRVLTASLETPPTAQQWQLLGLIGATTFLVGFSEELMFRGVLLRAALTRLTAAPAMLLSAGAFSLLHTVNLLAGQSLTNTIHQLAFTFLVGFFLAPIALRIGNLWPLIIWHWLWNFALFSGEVLDVLHPFALTGLLVQAVVSVWLWIRLIRRT